MLIFCELWSKPGGMYTESGIRISKSCRAYVDEELIVLEVPKKNKEIRLNNIILTENEGIKAENERK